MFLKRIELGGFKLFADKTEMEFVRGITAVVGPNGSGKSNISDEFAGFWGNKVPSRCVVARWKISSLQAVTTESR